MTTMNNFTSIEMARCMSKGGNFPNSIWVDVVDVVMYLLNRSLIGVVEGKIAKNT